MAIQFPIAVFYFCRNHPDHWYTPAAQEHFQFPMPRDAIQTRSSTEL